MDSIDGSRVAKLYTGDASLVLNTFPSSSVDMVMTSPPYWGLRDYGSDEQIGLEPSVVEYVDRIIEVCNELLRVLKPTGSFYLNLGDSYIGSFGNMSHKPSPHTNSESWLRHGQKERPPTSLPQKIRRKSLAGVPWRIALRLIDEGWILRNGIIWHKTNGLPSSVKDRLSNRYEFLFHLVKSERYYYNLEAIREPYRPSSFARYHGLVKQGFIKRKSKYTPLELSPTLQFSKGRTPVPSWLSESTRVNQRSTLEHLKKMRQIYVLSRGKTKHGHLGSGEFVGITSSVPGKNPGDIWSLPTSGFKGAHFSVYPERLCFRPILSSCPLFVCRRCGKPKRELAGRAAARGGSFNIRVRDAQRGRLNKKWGHALTASKIEVGSYDESNYDPSVRPRVISEGCHCATGYVRGVVLDPFAGAGTTMKVAHQLGRRSVGIELNPDYARFIMERVPGLKLAANVSRS